MNIFTKSFCFLIGPDAHVPFYSNGDQVLDQAKLYQFTVPVFGPNVVFDVDWPIRKQQLGFVRDRFALRSMDGYVSLVEGESQEFFPDLAKRGRINIRNEMMELLTRTSTACLMGAEARAALHEGVAECLHDLEQGMQSYSVFATYLPTARHRKRDAARKKIGALFSKILDERRKNTSSTRPQDIIDKLMQSSYSGGGQQLNDDEITGLCIAAFFGGMHNSAITTAWTLLYIHDNPKILERAKHEVAQVYKDSGGKLDYKTLNTMTFLKACVKESLRLRPPLVILMRTLQSQINVCGYNVAPGTVVVTCPPVSHRIESIYPDPETFNPDRWLERDEKSLPQHSFIAFGDGPRRCLGEHFGNLQIMMIVAHCLQNYDLRLVNGCPGASFQGMVVGPEGDCLVDIKPLS